MSGTLYFITRKDLHPGLRASQLVHAMDEWSGSWGKHGGTVIIYEVPNERQLVKHLHHRGRSVLWCEPDLDNEATAFATDQGPLRLPLLRA